MAYNIEVTDFFCRVPCGCDLCDKITDLKLISIDHHEGECFQVALCASCRTEIVIELVKSLDGNK